MIAFATRVLRVFLRDRATVFFTYFSSLILLVLYVAFFGKMNVDSLLQDAPGLERSKAVGFVAAWVVAALITITSINGPMAGLNRLVTDKTSGHMADFLVAPLAARQLMGGYLLATWLYTLCSTTAVAVVGLTGVAVLGASLPNLTGWLLLVGLLLVSSLVFSALYLLAGSFLHTQGAASAASGLIGALSGFLALAYIPAGLLGGPTVTVANLMPFAPAATVARQAVALRPLDAMGVPGDMREDLLSYLGMDLRLFGSTYPTWMAWLIMLIYGALAFGLTVALAGRLRRHTHKV